MQYPKPNIILIDLDEGTKEKLLKNGFNVSVGSFGKPYYVEKEDKYDFIYAEYELPNLREQEIVIIDLKTKIVEKKAPNKKITVDRDDDVRVRLINGIVDPRPLTMFLNYSQFSKILNYKGIFLVFADSMVTQEYQFSKKENYGWYNTKELKINLLSFLHYLNEQFLYFVPDKGNEFKLFNKDNEWSKIILKYLKDSQYKVTIKFEPWKREYILPIILNKYDEIVGGLVINNDKSLIIILPQIKEKSNLIYDLLTNILPLKFPDLFPYYEGSIWMNISIYDLEPIKNLKDKKEKIILEKKKLVDSLDQEILEEKKKSLFLCKILTETGDELVKAIEEVFKLIGFQKILNVDKELTEKNNKLKQEDLRILDKSPIIITEVKGIIGLPREEDTFQIVKYIMRRMKDWQSTDVKGLVIVNHQRNLPPLRRERIPFTEQQTGDAEQNNFGMLSTWNLFLLIKGMLKYSWEKDYVKSLFYINGLISNIPAHYKKIGFIENYWEHHKVVGIRLNNDFLKKGDKISFISSSDYFEQEVSSIQVDKIDKEIANQNELAGVKTQFSKEELEKGLIVYKIMKD